MKYILIISLVFSIISIQSCELNNNNTALSYNADIAPLLTSCSSPYCHGAAHSAGSTATYESTKDFAAKEAFLAAIKHEAGYAPMPQGGEMLSEESIELIEEWLNQGMPE